MKGKPILYGALTLLLVLAGVFLFNLSKDKEDTIDSNQPKKTESTEESVEESKLDEGVLMKIDDTDYTEEDIEFMKYMQWIQIEKLEKEGNDMSEKKRTQNSNNVQLQNIAELKMMASLAKEKGFGFDYDKVKKEKEVFLKKYNDTEMLKEAKESFGDDFDNRLHEYIEEKMMIARVVKEIEKDKKREFENITEDELRYEVATEYQLLLEDERDDHSIVTRK